MPTRCCTVDNEITNNVFPIRAREGVGPPPGEAQSLTSSEPHNFDKTDPLWFLNPQYNPMPEYDIVVGSYRFRYRSEYEMYFVNKGQEGYTWISIAATLGIPFQVIKRWARMIPSLGVALEMSRQAAQMHLEEQGRFIHSKDFNGQAWLKMMAVRFPETWGDALSTAAQEVSTTDDDIFGVEHETENFEAEANAQRIIEKIIRIKTDKSVPA